MKGKAKCERPAGRGAAECFVPASSKADQYKGGVSVLCVHKGHKIKCTTTISRGKASFL